MYGRDNELRALIGLKQDEAFDFGYINELVDKNDVQNDCGDLYIEEE